MLMLFQEQFFCEFFQLLQAIVIPFLHIANNKRQQHDERSYVWLITNDNVCARSFLKQNDDFNYCRISDSRTRQFAVKWIPKRDKKEVCQRHAVRTGDAA